MNPLDIVASIYVSLHPTLVDAQRTSLFHAAVPNLAQGLGGNQLGCCPPISPTCNYFSQPSYRKYLVTRERDWNFSWMVSSMGQGRMGSASRYRKGPAMVGHRRRVPPHLFSALVSSAGSTRVISHQQGWCIRNSLPKLVWSCYSCQFGNCWSNTI